mmetsp:Transcript_9806/g.23997  ORF Transcript_9806/g.23997 Transcript_9806/m.23997 type:complete len:360 (-) Transcript_9806:1175-2254(-)
MRSLLALALIVAPAAAFSPASNMLLAGPTSAAVNHPRLRALPTCVASSRMMAVSEVSSSTGTGSTEFLPAQRYMGVNRFSTRGGDAGAKWEEQWTHREYSMLERPGFRVSSLLRRTDNGGAKYEDGEDYMAMTVFDTKDTFMDWKTKFSFKEAHAGGGPVGFVTSFVDTLMVLTGSPAGSGWEAALAISAGGGAFSYKDRDAEGKVNPLATPLSAECFIKEERFRVPEGNLQAFEQMRASMGKRTAQATPEATPAKKEGIIGRLMSSMGKKTAAAAAAPPAVGLVGAYVLRRDPGFGHGGDQSFNYAVFSIWASKGEYTAWDASPAAAAGKAAMDESISGPATTVFWEGTQSVLSPKGV